jgi:hypothetical protein
MSLFGAAIFSTIALLVILAVSWFLFSRINIVNIDKRMKEAGVPRSCPVDIMGMRVLMIASAISLPVGFFLNPSTNPLIDVESVRRFSMPNDKKLGLLVCISAYGFAVCCIVGYFLIPEAAS